VQRESIQFLLGILGLGGVRNCNQVLPLAVALADRTSRPLCDGDNFYKGITEGESSSL
jgi:hypothetical protein